MVGGPRIGTALNVARLDATGRSRTASNAAPRILACLAPGRHNHKEDAAAADDPLTGTAWSVGRRDALGPNPLASGAVHQIPTPREEAVAAATEEAMGAGTETEEVATTTTEEVAVGIAVTEMTGTVGMETIGIRIQVGTVEDMEAAEVVAAMAVEEIKAVGTAADGTEIEIMAAISRALVF